MWNNAFIAVALIVGMYAAAAQEKAAEDGKAPAAIPLEKAVKDGKVEVSAVGLAGENYETILLSVQRKGQEPLRLSLAPGTVFKCKEEKAQDLISAAIKFQRVGSESRPCSEILIDGDGKFEYVVEAYCLDIQKDPPGGYGYTTVGGEDKSIAQIIVRGKEAGLKQDVIQCAIWLHRSGNLSSSQLRGSSNADDKDIDAARRLQKDSQRIGGNALRDDEEKTRNGRLFVKTYPGGATVRLVEPPMEFQQGIELKSGTYIVEISAEGYETQRSRARINAGADKIINAHLRIKH